MIYVLFCVKMAVNLLMERLLYIVVTENLTVWDT